MYIVITIAIKLFSTENTMSPTSEATKANCPTGQAFYIM